MLGIGRRSIGEHAMMIRWQIIPRRSYQTSIFSYKHLNQSKAGGGIGWCSTIALPRRQIECQCIQGKRSLGYSTNLKKEHDNRNSIYKGVLDQEKNGSSEKVVPASSLYSRIKFALLKTNRPYSFDDLSALFSWLLMGNVLWIVLGTTTFGLVFMYSAHTFDNLWEKVAYRDDGDKKSNQTSILSSITGPILSDGLGLKFEFQKGSPLPSFKDGMLKFRNVHVKTENNPVLDLDASVEELNMSLSFNKWFEGKGLINELEMYGMRGKLTKAHSTTKEQSIKQELNPSITSLDNQVLHYQYDFHDHLKDENKSSDYNDAKSSSVLDSNYSLKNVKVRDSYFEISDKNTQVPLKISIINCELPVLNGDRVLLDFFNANNVTGTINDSMFTIHKRQKYDDSISEFDHIRFKLDGIDLKSVTKRDSMFSWIIEGKAQVIADLRIPQIDKTNTSMNNFSVEYKSITSFFSSLVAELSKFSSDDKSGTDISSASDKNTILKSALTAIYETFSNPKSDSNGERSASEYVMVNVKIKFDNIKASLPNSLPMANSVNLPFISLHNLRSLISFVNNYDFEKRSSIVVQTEVIEKISDFYHVEKISQTKMYDIVINDLYGELLNLVKQDEKRILDKKSSMWSHSFASQILLLGLGVIV